MCTSKLQAVASGEKKPLENDDEYATSKKIQELYVVAIKPGSKSTPKVSASHQKRWHRTLP